ncbi:hypothetical protein Tco_1410713 [Tanacetum coccineum]
MDDPGITMEEYIQLEAERACRRDQEFNWETAMYVKVMYFENIDYSNDFENEFPAIVYKDALTSELEVSSEPTCSPGDNSDLFSVIESVFPDYRYGDLLEEKMNVVGCLFSGFTRVS